MRGTSRNLLAFLVIGCLLSPVALGTTEGQAVQVESKGRIFSVSQNKNE